MPVSLRPKRCKNTPQTIPWLRLHKVIGVLSGTRGEAVHTKKAAEEENQYGWIISCPGVLCLCERGRTWKQPHDWALTFVVVYIAIAGLWLIARNAETKDGSHSFRGEA